MYYQTVVLRIQRIRIRRVLSVIALYLTDIFSVKYVHSTEIYSGKNWLNIEETAQNNLTEMKRYFNGKLLKKNY